MDHRRTPLERLLDGAGFRLAVGGGGDSHETCFGSILRADRAICADHPRFIRPRLGVACADLAVQTDLRRDAPRRCFRRDQRRTTSGVLVAEQNREVCHAACFGQLATGVQLVAPVMRLPVHPLLGASGQS